MIKLKLGQFFLLPPGYLPQKVAVVQRQPNHQFRNGTGQEGYCSLYTLICSYKKGKPAVSLQQALPGSFTQRHLHLNSDEAQVYLWSGACPINPCTRCRYTPEAQAVVSLLPFLTLHQMLRAERFQEEPFWPISRCLCEPFSATKLVPLCIAALL